MKFLSKLFALRNYWPSKRPVLCFARDLALQLGALALMLFTGPVALAAFAFPTRGRLIQVKRGASSPGTLVAGVRTKSLQINGEPIDITNDDDAGWRKLLDQPGEVQVEISVSGILKDETLATEAVNTADRSQYTGFEWPGAGTPGKMSGEFFLSSFQITGEYQGAATFEASFLSNGPIAFTAAV